MRICSACRTCSGRSTRRLSRRAKTESRALRWCRYSSSAASTRFSGSGADSGAVNVYRSAEVLSSARPPPLKEFLSLTAAVTLMAVAMCAAVTVGATGAKR